MAAATIYKLLTRAQWGATQEEGVYRGSAHDKRDGFIHFSTAAQLAETAQKHFPGVADLVLLAVDVRCLLDKSLRFEPSRGGDLFPHLYAPLPISAVKSLTAVPLAEDGTPILPADLEP
jgi:uncharacterized protein (DUF952 family)